MTTHPHLEGLIRKWREESKRRHEEAFDSEEIDDQAWNSGIASSLTECADELSQALAALPGGGVDDSQQDLLASCWLAIDSIPQESVAKSALLARIDEATSAPVCHWMGVMRGDGKCPRCSKHHSTPNPHEADRNG